MLKKKTPAVNLRDHHAVVNFQAYFLREIIKNPYVVIALEPYYLHALVGKPCELSEKACKPSWHHIAIFPPVVEYVAKQKYSPGCRLDRAQKLHHHALVGTMVGYISGSEMQGR